ncbi:DUF6392 family protein [Pseudomonas sp. Fl4BN1]|uniref:DUF6392 family protein n=1 Tax=Pseudomonas sp. Fl4BN1 TaxID=2697651 RepID=UPI003555E1CE
MGSNYSKLLENNTIPSTPLEKQYEDSDWLTLDIDVGIDLEFWAESRVFGKLHIVIKQTMENIPAYQGELPSPFYREMDKPHVRSLLGAPRETREPFKMPVIGLVGGWGSYVHPERPEIRVFLSYTADMKVDTLSFILHNPEHT